MQGALEGRKALVTGGSRGIGASIVELFAGSGAAVAFCHVGDNERADRLVRKLSDAGSTASHLECDVSDEDAVARMLGWAADRLGPVDILVNCAGIGGEVAFPAMTAGAWDRMIAVHLRGTFLVTHGVFAGMLARGRGRIINIASQLAYKGSPGLAHYCAAKAGIIGFTRALALEGAPHGVLVNAIAPGPVETDLLAGLSAEWHEMKRREMPVRRFGTVEEIAPTALLLASAGGSFYVGQTLSPNGGDVMI